MIKENISMYMKRAISILVAVIMLSSVATAIEGDITTDHATDTNFSDVSPTAWYYHYVMLSCDCSFMDGIANDKFCPEMKASRAQAVQVIFACAYKPETDSKTCMFNDIDKSAWYYNAVNWGASIGITKGYKDGTFRPNEEIKRQDMACMLYCFAGYQLGEKDIKNNNKRSINEFNDCDKISKYAQEAMSWCVSNNLMGGYGGSIYPHKTLTRAEMATISVAYLRYYTDHISTKTN